MFKKETDVLREISERLSAAVLILFGIELKTHERVKAMVNKRLVAEESFKNASGFIEKIKEVINTLTHQLEQ